MFPRKPKRVVRHAEWVGCIVGVAVDAAVDAVVDAVVDTAVDTVVDTAAVDTAVVDTAVEGTLEGTAVAAAVVAGNTQSHCLPAKVDGRDPGGTSTHERAPDCGKEKTRWQSRPRGQSSWDEQDERPADQIG